MVDIRNIKWSRCLQLCWIIALLGYQGKVLEPLGAITTGSQFLEPDGKIYSEIFIQMSRRVIFYKNLSFQSGMFPNHIPNPEDKTAMKAITQAVLDNKADLGIIFDTDVDR